jgi:hypothetical protein
MNITQLRIGNVTVDSIIERDGPWRMPADLCWDPAMAARTRRVLLSSVADTDMLLLPIHFPAPTAGRVESDGTRFRYRFRNRLSS